MMPKRQNEAKDVEPKEKEETIAKKIRAIEGWTSTLDNYKVRSGEKLRGVTTIVTWRRGL